MRKISLSSFFQNNKSLLEKWYSGITLKRLEEELHYYISHKKGSEGSFQAALLEGIPLEQINQNAFFYRSDFFVTSDVLIPRSETEILVEDAINHIEKNYHSHYRIAEVGVGSFCIGLSILQDIEGHLSYWGGDICPKALDIAKKNCTKHQDKISPYSRVDLVLSDCLKKARGEFDLIISNPPYVRESLDRDGVHEQTLKYEPHLALFLPDNEFEKWFEDFFKSAKRKLTSSGAFMMEGHEDTLKYLIPLAKKYFRVVETKVDYTQRDRFLYCYN